MYIKFYINNEIVSFPISGDIPMYLNLSIENVEDLNSLVGSAVRNAVTFPYTNTNEILFKRFADPRVIDNFRSFEYEIIANGIPVFKGRADITQATLVNNYYRRKGLDIKAYLYGNNANWFSSLSNLRVKYLNWGAYEVNDFFWQNNDDNHADNDEFCTSLIYHDDMRLGGAITLRDVQLPCIFLKQALDKAFNQIGYRLNSQFFETNEFKKLIIPLDRILSKYKETAGEYLGFQTPTIIDINNNQGKLELTDIGTGIEGEFFSNQIFDDVNGVIDYSVSPNFSRTANMYELVAFAKFRATKDYVSPQLFSSVGVGLSGYDSNGTLLDPVSTDMNLVWAKQSFTQNETFEKTIRVQNRVYRNDLVYELQGFSNDINAGLEIVAVEIRLIPSWTSGTNTYSERFIPTVNYPIWGFDYNISDYISNNWFISDWINDLTKLFGLLWQTDEDLKIITVEPRDEYNLPSGNYNGFFDNEIIDLNKKRDLSKNGYIKLNDLKNYFFEYENTEDNANKYETENNVNLYSCTFNVGAEKTEDIQISNFVKIVHFDETLEPLSGGRQIPIISNNDNNAHLLIFERSSINNHNITDNNGLAIPFGRSYFHDYQEKINDKFTLSFSNIDNTLGICNRFHLRNLARKKNSRTYQDWILFNNIDIMNFDFRKFYQLEGVNMIIKSIDGYNLQNRESTKVIFEIDVYPTNDELDNLEHETATGIIIE